MFVVIFFFNKLTKEEVLRKQGLEGYDYENYDAWNFYNSMLPATLKRIKNKNTVKKLKPPSVLKGIKFKK